MEERILYFDIVNGISGDMTIATLLDLGISKEIFLEEINKLNLGDEFNINIQEENENGIVGTKVEESIQNLGKVSDKGMQITDEIILNVMNDMNKVK